MSRIQLHSAHLSGPDMASSHYAYLIERRNITDTSGGVMSELEAYTQAVADLEKRGVFQFSDNSTFRTTLPGTCTLEDVSNWSVAKLEEYLVARSVLDNLRFIETVVSSVA